MSVGDDTREAGAAGMNEECSVWFPFIKCAMHRFAHSRSFRRLSNRELGLCGSPPAGAAVRPHEVARFRVAKRGETGDANAGRLRFVTIHPFDDGNGRFIPIECTSTSGTRANARRL